MLILNPTAEAVVAKHDGGTYLFKPGEQKEIFNGYAGRHILKRWEKCGLVDITYNERIESKFGSHDTYIQSQRLEGLGNLIAALMVKAEGFKTYDEECGDKRSVVRMRYAQQAKKVEKKLTAATELLGKAEKITDKDLAAAKRVRLKAQIAELDKELKGTSKTE